MSDPPQQIAKLFVGNITDKVQKHELRAEFEKFGNVEEVFIAQGYGFVTFEDPQCAAKAVEEMDGLNYAGDRLRVEFSRGRGRGRGRGFFRDRREFRGRGYYGVSHYRSRDYGRDDYYRRYSPRRHYHTGETSPRSSDRGHRRSPSPARYYRESYCHDVERRYDSRDMVPRVSHRESRRSFEGPSRSPVPRRYEDSAKYSYVPRYRSRSPPPPSRYISRTPPPRGYRGHSPNSRTASQASYGYDDVDSRKVRLY